MDGAPSRHRGEEAGSVHTEDRAVRAACLAEVAQELYVPLGSASLYTYDVPARGGALG